jgi:hypothetical protein
MKRRALVLIIGTALTFSGAVLPSSSAAGNGPAEKDCPGKADDPQVIQCKCENKWARYDYLGQVWRLTLGGVKIKASGSVGNATGEALDKDGHIVDLDKDDGGGSVALGYYDKAIARDVLYLREKWFMDYCKKKKNDPAKILLWDAFKFGLQGGYGSTVTEEDDTNKELSYEEKWFYTASLSYEIPLESLVEGVMNLKSLDE